MRGVRSSRLFFLSCVLGAILVAERICLFGFGIGRQEAFDRADDAGGRRALAPATDAGERAMRAPRGLDKALRVGLCCLGRAIGKDALFEAIGASTVANMARVVDRGRDLGGREQGFRNLHGQNYTDKRFPNG